MPDLPPLELFSIVIPARDEAGCITAMLRSVHAALAGKGISHELIVVDDGSRDGTWEVLQGLRSEIPELRPVANSAPHGFGHAVRCGLQHFSGDAVAIMMADESDRPADLLRYWEILQAGTDCVFGSRFTQGGAAHDYPPLKLILNRVANKAIQALFSSRLDDTTNAFKAYRKEVIQACQPLESPHFELTVELPLKAMTHGFTWAMPPIEWHNRQTGVSKLHLREMGSRYLRCVWRLWRVHHGSHAPLTTLV
ncbi:MAG: glycosyltransferase family 2 protein [Verrucomicrobiota bacterium]